MTEGIDRRNQIIRSRRYSDCFPDGGVMTIAIGIASVLWVV